MRIGDGARRQIERHRERVYDLRRGSYARSLCTFYGGSFGCSGLYSGVLWLSPCLYTMPKAKSMC